MSKKDISSDQNVTLDQLIEILDGAEVNVTNAFSKEGPGFLISYRKDGILKIVFRPTLQEALRDAVYLEEMERDFKPFED